MDAIKKGPHDPYAQRETWGFSWRIGAREIKKNAGRHRGREGEKKMIGGKAGKTAGK